MEVYLKDPQAVLDWRFDWAALTNGAPGALTDWLAAGETISTYTVTVDAGLTAGTATLASVNTAVVQWLSGGTVGRVYNVVCHITTNAGRTDDRTLQIRVEDR